MVRPTAFQARPVRKASGSAVRRRDFMNSSAWSRSWPCMRRTINKSRLASQANDHEFSRSPSKNQGLADHAEYSDCNSAPTIRLLSVSRLVRGRTDSASRSPLQRQTATRLVRAFFLDTGVDGGRSPTRYRIGATKSGASHQSSTSGITERWCQCLRLCREISVRETFRMPVRLISASPISRRPNTPRTGLILISVTLNRWAQLSIPLNRAPQLVFVAPWAVRREQAQLILPNEFEKNIGHGIRLKSITLERTRDTLIERIPDAPEWLWSLRKQYAPGQKRHYRSSAQLHFDISQVESEFPPRFHDWSPSQ